MSRVKQWRPHLGAVEDQDAVGVASTAGLVARAGEDPRRSWSARAEIVGGDECRAADPATDAAAAA